MSTPKLLPVGIPTFRDVINGGYLYVDKTPLISAANAGLALLDEGFKKLEELEVDLPDPQLSELMKRAQAILDQ